MKSSRAPARFISSRTMVSTLRTTRRPIGIQLYMPPASRRISPARIIRRWLMISASEGASLSVAMKYFETRIG